ncbi:MAG: CBS domain-containing protein [Candidatus Lokiarchaeota archaeon]|nr:CBS domain-containing protein [Candidatus Lokiarchaeota archaeon]
MLEHSMSNLKHRKALFLFEIFDKKNSEEFPTKSQTFYQVFLCYFDEARGHLPLYTFPSELKYDENELRIIKIHSIWFLDSEAQENLSHVDLEYGDKIYLAMKFKGKSWRTKNRAGLEEDTPETYVLIISLPREYSFLGSDLLISLYSKIKDLSDSMYILIKAELASKKVIKNEKDKTIIQEGIAIENDIQKVCGKLLPNLSPDVGALKSLVSAETRKQEKLAYLLFQDMINKTPEKTREFEISIDNNKLQENKRKFFVKKVKIVNVELSPTNDRLKLTIKNFDDDLKNIKIQISQVKSFFETSSWETSVDTWYSGEELVFQYPITDFEVVFQLKVNKMDGEVLLRKNIKPKKYLPEIESPLEVLKVRDFMNPAPATISYSSNIVEAVKIMNKEKLDYILVTLDDVPIGIITPRDLLQKVINSCILARNIGVKQIQCKNIMSSPLHFTSEDTSIQKAALQIIQAGIKKLPVLKDKQIKGIISTNDLINAYLSIKMKDEKSLKDEKIREISELTKNKVQSIMQKNVIKMDFNQSCQELLQILIKKKIGSVVVLQHNKPVGIVTERNVFKKIIEDGMDPKTTVIGDLMSSPIISITPDTEIVEAIEIMKHKGIRYIPIMNENDPYLIEGIISNTDILNLDVSTTLD